MEKEEILSEYFLVETEKTDEMKGWKVVGTIEGCAGQSVSPLLELKTDGDGWLCDFKIKLLHCGLVLCSPEYVIDEDELVMEAMEKVWGAWGAAQQLQEVLNQQIQEKLDEATITDPYYPHGTWTTCPDNGNWTTITAPYDSTWTNTIITCSSATNYISATDSAINETLTTCSDYATACASATCTC